MKYGQNVQKADPWLFWSVLTVEVKMGWCGQWGDSPMRRRNGDWHLKWEKIENNHSGLFIVLVLICQGRGVVNGQSCLLLWAKLIAIVLDWGPANQIEWSRHLLPTQRHSHTIWYWSMWSSHCEQKTSTKQSILILWKENIQMLDSLYTFFSASFKSKTKGSSETHIERKVKRKSDSTNFHHTCSM